MAYDSVVYDAHDVLDLAGVRAEGLAAEGLTERIRFLVAERDELRRQLTAGQCLRMTAWCKRNGHSYDAYRAQAIAQRPELAEKVRGGESA